MLPECLTELQEFIAVLQKTLEDKLTKLLKSLLNVKNPYNPCQINASKIIFRCQQTTFLPTFFILGSTSWEVPIILGSSGAVVILLLAGMILMVVKYLRDKDKIKALTRITFKEVNEQHQTYENDRNNFNTASYENGSGAGILTNELIN